MSVLLAADANAAQGNDFTVPANTAFTVAVFSADNVFAQNTDGIMLERKTENNSYTLAGWLNNANGLVQVLPPLGVAVTYRARKFSTKAVIGLEGS